MAKGSGSGGRGGEVNAAGDDGGSNGSDTKRARLRHRVPKSCLPCLSGKRACDRRKPVCSRCERIQHECIYTEEPLPVPRMARRSDVLKSDPDRKPAADDSAAEEAYADRIDESDEMENEDDSDQRHKRPRWTAPHTEHSIGYVARQHDIIHHAKSASSYIPSPPSRASRGDLKHDPWTDSDVHSAGQALVHLQGSTPWSISTPNTTTTDASPASIDRSYISASGSMQQQQHPSHFANGPSTGTSAKRASSLRSTSSTATPGRLREDDGAGSHVNLNGQPLWHGETVTGTSVFNQVPTSSSGGVSASVSAVGGGGGGTSSIGAGGPNATGAAGVKGSGDGSRNNAGNDSAGSGVSTEQDGDSDEQNGMRVASSEMPHNIQSAFNGLLYPMADSFPFETIWSSGSNFKQEVLPLFPAAKDGKAIIDSFKRFMRVASPGLLDNNITSPAETFLCLRSEREREMISLPWMASFFMMVAIGQESQRACGPTMGDDGEEEDVDDGRPLTANASEGAQHQRKDGRQTDTRRHCDLLLSATYQALRLCSFLGSPNLQTIYAQLLIGIYLLHTERASNAWPILGSITRQAQSIGLHVEPSNIRSGGCASVEERELRRRLWWTIVQQDVLLSSIFGRPLAVSRFTCRISPTAPAAVGAGTSLDKIERSTSYQDVLCQFAVFARRQLNDDYEQEWSESQVRQYKDDLLAWYHDLPSQLIFVQAAGTEDGDGSFVAPSKSVAEKRHLRDQLSRRSATTIQHAVDLDLQVQFALLTLFRNRLITAVPVDGKQKGSTTHDNEEKAAQQNHLNERSLAECSRYVHRITLALSTLVDLLGTLQAGMVWVRVFYAFHAGVTAAYLALSRPTTWLGARARDDLATLTDVCQRLPDRFDGLQTVKATFGVLSRLVQVHPDQHHHRRAAAAHAGTRKQGEQGSLSNSKSADAVNHATTSGRRSGAANDDEYGRTADMPTSRYSISSSADGASGFAMPSYHMAGHHVGTPRGAPTPQQPQQPHSVNTSATHDQEASLHDSSSGYSPLRLDELLSSNNIGLPAFNISRDPPVSGLAPFFDQSYMPGAATPGVTAHSGGGDMHSVLQSVDGSGSNATAMQTSSTPSGVGSMYIGTPHGFNSGGGGGGTQHHVQFSSLPPAAASTTANTTSAATGNGNHHHMGSSHPLGEFGTDNGGGPPQPPSRPDRGFPEPFGPMIAPPGPDASTNEIVSFWRDFFALPFEASDMGLA